MPHLRGVQWLELETGQGSIPATSMLGHLGRCVTHLSLGLLTYESFPREAQPSRGWGGGHGSFRDP